MSRSSLKPATTTHEADSRTASEGDSTSLMRRFRSWLRAYLKEKHPDNSLKEAIEEVLEEHEEEAAALAPEEQNLLKNMLSFGELAVIDIMTLRTDIKAVEYNISLPELKAHITLHRHTRIPVYNDALDNIKGFIHIKDLVPLLSGDTPFNMALILRDLLFVPPSMKLINLLMKMRDAGVHMAIVVDEYGGTDGLVTLEDLFEEIVGDIQDEHDEDEDQELHLSWTSQGYCDVDARIPAEQLESLGIALAPAEEADYDSLGGLIFYQIGRVPARGEVIAHESGARFEILSADPRRIHRIRIYRPPPVTGEKAEK